MHYSRSVLHLTLCLVTAVNKSSRRDMCFDTKNGKKQKQNKAKTKKKKRKKKRREKKPFPDEVPANECRNVRRGLKSTRSIKKSRFSYKESGNCEPLRVNTYFISFYIYVTLLGATSLTLCIFGGMHISDLTLLFYLF